MGNSAYNCTVAGSVSTIGYTALWIGFAFMVFSAIVFLFLSYVRNVKPEGRFAYYTTAAINGIAALAYLIMALGATQYCTISGRAFLWVRYVDWFFTVPLLILDLGVLAGAHWSELYFTMVCSAVMIAAGYAGAIDSGYNATWPLFTFGFVVYIPVAVSLLTSFRTNAYRHHVEIGKLYDLLAFGSVILYAGYGIVWGCSEGGLIMTVDQEVIVYTVLDIISKCVFGFVLLFSREAIARYGTFLGGINTGQDFDFPIPGTVYASSAGNYAAGAPKRIVLGEHRDLAFAQLHAATGTQPIEASTSRGTFHGVASDEDKEDKPLVLTNIGKSS